MKAEIGEINYASWLAARLSFFSASPDQKKTKPMKIKLFTIGLAVALLAGCHTSSTRMNQISIGMTEKQVRNVLGSPSSKSVNKDGSTTLYYTLNEAVMGEYPVPYSVHLTDDKVDFYGRDAGGTQMPRPIVTPVIVH